MLVGYVRSIGPLNVVWSAQSAGAGGSGGLLLIENETHLQLADKRNIDGRFFHLKGPRCGSFALRPAVGSPDVMRMAFPRPVLASKSTRETSEAL